jgi:hypothetical protein
MCHGPRQDMRHTHPRLQQVLCQWHLYQRVACGTDCRKKQFRLTSPDVFALLLEKHPAAFELDEEFLQ